MACRFIEADDELIEILKCESENKNTKRSTGYWKGIFEKWAKTRGKEEQLESYDTPELNEALSQFYAELRKENGQDYEPDSLKVMQAALDRHLRSKNYPKSIVRDTEFLSLRKVLEGKARKLREQGMGKRPNKAKSLTKEEEEILWQNGHARKTVVKKLKSSGIPKCEIKNITGHKSEQGLDDYDSGDENEQKIMSNIIDNAKPASTSRQVLHPLSSVQTQSRSASSHVYNFSHCNVTLNVAGNHSLQSSLSQSKRAYKRIMLQDSDSD
ncbi:unnamed protein product [Porites lobata]|uniref:QRICH1-like domain-containing protein n=1 Tax=Porites lobata TaxID=104759 RepID=A0ABN8Q6C5_9CNID|nr:unnamed protein product [Porites lobata]